MSKPVFEDMFTFSGRRNRKSYFLYTLVISVLAIAVFFLGAATGGIGFILFIPLIVSGWAIGAERCRDFGWTGWAILLSAIPFIGAIFAIAMYFIPGNIAENRYGSDPIGQ